jgi:hypothetical protein
MRRTRLRLNASTAAATARYVFPVPAGPMPMTMSLSAMRRTYSLCPGVRGWMIFRTPGRTMRVSPPDGASRVFSRLMRSTSSASSTCRWRAASIMRCATTTARSTTSAEPEIESTSPRIATRAPVCRASSVRFESFTPASVRGSTPSALSR